ncbi:TatD family hydrolase [bacterium]|nr:TatD family hydrolase [bacterium]
MVDTHAHLEFPEYAADLDGVIARAASAGVTAMICVGGEIPRNRFIAELVGIRRCLRAAYGIHPHWANGNTPAEEQWVREQCAARTTVAIGEIGLDYYYDYAPRSRQRDVFERYLALARDEGRPAIIHSRDAFADTFDVLKNFQPLRGVVHCFTYGLPEVEAFMSLGLHISFCGQITFPKCDALRAVASAVPLERLLLETDCPFLAPAPHRGKRNEPAFVRLTAEKHADLRGLSLGAIDAATTRNALALFGDSLPAGD